MAVRVGIVGVAGRMGAELVKAVGTEGRAVLAAAIDRPGGSAIGKDSGTLVGRHANGVAVGADLRSVIRELDVVIDFSRADAVGATAEVCAEAGVDMEFERGIAALAEVRGCDLLIGADGANSFVRRALEQEFTP